MHMCPGPPARAGPETVMPRRTRNTEVAALENSIENHVAGRIRLRRGLLGMSQSDLARALGITFQQVQKYERGSNRVSVGKLFRLAEILDVPLSFFFDGLEVPGVGRPPHAPVGFAEEQSPLLSRRDLDLLRAWRQAPPHIADAIASLMRAIVLEETDEPGEEGGPGGEAGGGAPGAGTGTSAGAAPRARGRPRKTATAAAGRRRGAVWDPSDIDGGRKA